MAEIVFVDVETTGLDPQRHTILEMALIKGNREMAVSVVPTDGEMKVAESTALKLNNFWSRKLYDEVAYEGQRWDEISGEWLDDRSRYAKEVAQFTDRCILAGNTVKFDQQFLEVWLRRHGACPTWDYHVLDVPTFAAGYLLSSDGGIVKIEPPFKSSKISAYLDVPEPEGDDKHTALADARWSKAVWEKVINDGY